MDYKALKKLAQRAQLIRVKRERQTDNFARDSGKQITYSTADILSAFECYSTERKVRNDLNEIEENGIHKFDRLGNSQFALTQKQMLWLAEYKKEPRYEFFKTRAVVAGIINLKGGVGKSTTSVMAAEAFVTLVSLIVRGLKVCLIDLDPQASSTYHFLGMPTSDDSVSALKLMSMSSEGVNEGFVNKFVVRNTDLENLDVIPASTDDGFVADKLYDFAKDQGIKVHDLLYEKVIKHIENKYDFIFVDVGPHMDAVLKSALGAVDGYYIPTTPKATDFDSTTKFIQRLPDLNQEMIDDGYDPTRCRFIKSFLNMVEISSSNKKSVYNDTAKFDLTTIFQNDTMVNSLKESLVHRRCMHYRYTVFSMSERAFSNEGIGDKTTFVNVQKEATQWAEEMYQHLSVLHGDIAYEEHGNGN